MVWEQFINKVVKVTYNDTPTSVAILTGKLLKEDDKLIVVEHNGVPTIIFNEKIVKISDYSFMDYIRCSKCGYYNWFPKGSHIEKCNKCGATL